MSTRTATRTRTYTTTDMDGGGAAEVVALAIQEFPSVWIGANEPLLSYYVLELNAQGFVVDDWGFLEDSHGALG